MYGLYIDDVKGTCSPITSTMCVKYKKNKKFTFVLGLKSRVVTDFMQFIIKILIRFDIKNYI